VLLVKKNFRKKRNNDLEKKILEEINPTRIKQIMEK
jgi:hypothetical protein